MANVRNAVSYLAMAAMLMTVANATDYTVTWTTGVDYEAYASAINFMVGDTILFIYTGNHNLVQVSKEDYATCTSTSPIDQDDSGASTVTLTDSNTLYLICGTPGHCERGMRVEIDVMGSSGKQSPPEAASPPPPGEASAPPPPGATSAPPPPRATNKFSTVGGSAHRISSAGSFALAFAVITMLTGI